MRNAEANPAAVHYHFGSREALADAVLDRLLEPLQVRRLAVLEAAVAMHGPDVPLPVLVEALVRPDVELALEVTDRNPGASGVVGAIYIRPAAFVPARVEESFAPVAGRFPPHLTTAAPHVPADELAWRVRWVVFGALGALLSEGAEDLAPQSIEATVAQMVTTLTGALAAPPPEEGAAG